MSALVDPRPMESVADGPVEAACPCCDGRELRACYPLDASQGVTAWALVGGVVREVDYDGVEEVNETGQTEAFFCRACQTEHDRDDLTLYRGGRIIREGRLPAKRSDRGLAP